MKINSKTLGILGGGQLGRMSALAAAKLGISTHIYCPEEGCPASLVTNRFTVADYEDENALKNFADSADVISYEFENIPLKTIQFLQKYKPVYPDDKLLEVSQNRLKEKEFLNSLGIETALWAPAHGPADIDSFMERYGASQCIVKTARFGYDGKGQIKHRLNDDSSKNWSTLNTQEAVIEGIVDFTQEVSIIIARDTFGKSVTFPLTLNDHKNHILSQSIAPVRLGVDIEARAVEMVTAIADTVGLVGVLALELFVSKDRKLIANEIAPRTHNSGHWTMDACNVSQFDLHVRAVCGLPVLEPKQHSGVTMINLIGNDVKKLSDYYAQPNACVHLYGKTEAREGRKMGHVNLLKSLDK